MKNIFAITCAVCATYLMYHGIDGWGWLLVLALLAGC